MNGVVLTVDAGNTRLKWGVHGGEAWLRQGWVLTTDAVALDDALRDMPVPAGIVAANVAGESAQAAVDAFAAARGLTVYWVRGCPMQCGVRSSYAEPETLGPDRWAALIAARGLAAGACVVVNVGTTMTVDALNDEGLFLGGCIVPGLAVMRTALGRETANLSPRDGGFRYFPDNTGDAIASGAVNALAGTVERMRRFVAEARGGAVPPVILSGGDAAQVEAQIGGDILPVDNLVLEGLLRIARSDC